MERKKIEQLLREKPFHNKPVEKTPPFDKEEGLYSIYTQYLELYNKVYGTNYTPIDRKVAKEYPEFITDHLVYIEMSTEE